MNKHPVIITDAFKNEIYTDCLHIEENRKGLIQEYIKHRKLQEEISKYEE